MLFIFANPVYDELLYGVLSGMDRQSAGVGTGKVRKPDGHHSKSGQDMVAGIGDHERVSVRTK